MLRIYGFVSEYFLFREGRTATDRLACCLPGLRSGAGTRGDRALGAHRVGGQGAGFRGAGGGSPGGGGLSRWTGQWVGDLGPLGFPGRVALESGWRWKPSQSLYGEGEGAQGFAQP